MSRGFSNVSDVIALKSLNTGGQSVGNGGDGTSSGAIINKPTLSFDPTNKAEGASVSVNTGDHVKQSADWDAGGANAKASFFSKAHGGDANRMEVRNRIAATIPPRSTPIRTPPRRTSCRWICIRTWRPGSAATAEVTISHWVETSPSTSTSDFRMLQFLF